jgi:hypothetical protein
VKHVTKVVLTNMLRCIATGTAQPRLSSHIEEKIHEITIDELDEFVADLSSKMEDALHLHRRQTAESVLGNAVDEDPAPASQAPLAQGDDTKLASDPPSATVETSSADVTGEAPDSQGRQTVVKPVQDPFFFLRGSKK